VYARTTPGIRFCRDVGVNRRWGLLTTAAGARGAYWRRYFESPEAKTGSATPSYCPPRNLKEQKRKALAETYWQNEKTYLTNEVMSSLGYQAWLIPKFDSKKHSQSNEGTISRTLRFTA